MSKYPHYVFLLLCLCTIPAQAIPKPAMSEHSAAPAKNNLDVIHVRLGAENSWPPYSDEHGQGVSTELVKAAFAKNGITPSFQALPYARVLHDLDSGKIDGGFNVNRQATTEDRYVFGDIPLFTVKAYWFFLPDTHKEIKSFQDIPSKFRVGVIRDYEYGDEYEHHRHRFNEIKVPQQAQIIRMLKQGRIDAGIMFEHEAEFNMRKMQFKSSLFEKRFLNHHGDVYVAFSHKSPRARWMAQQLDKGLLMLKESGEYDRILSKANREP